MVSSPDGKGGSSVEPILFPVTSRVIIHLFNRPGEQVYGQVYSVYYDNFMEFCGILQLLRAMESLFDSLDMPQAAYENRELSPLRHVKKKDEDQKIERHAKRKIVMGEERASFMVHVVYRQYNTWQGTITWIEENITSRFKSVLEMLKLMDDVVNSSVSIEYIWNAK